LVDLLERPCRPRRARLDDQETVRVNLRPFQMLTLRLRPGH
jgi:hypothetical protein